MFISPDRQPIKYDDLSQSQWTAGLTAIATVERVPVIQRNMLIYLALLLHDVHDYRFQAGHGEHALVLTFWKNFN